MKKIIFALLISVSSQVFISLNVQATQRDDSSLSIFIAVSAKHGSRTIELYSPSSHFHILITNTSTHDIKLWHEWSSWGHANLRFEVTDEKGKSWFVNKKDKKWTKNFPDVITLSPDESHVMQVDFNPQYWKNSPLLESSESQKLKIRAIYEIKETDESKKLDIWTGTVVSAVQNYTLNK